MEPVTVTVVSEVLTALREVPSATAIATTPVRTAAAPAVRQASLLVAPVDSVAQALADAVAPRWFRPVTQPVMLGPTSKPVPAPWDV